MSFLNSIISVFTNRIILVGIVAFSFRPIIKAQEFIDIIKIESSSSSRSFENSSTDLNLREINVNIFAPILLANKNAVLLGFDYENLNTKVGSLTYLNVFSAGFRLGYNRVYADDLIVSYFVIPKITGEIGDFKNAEAQLGIAALGRRNLSNKSNYKIGFFINTDQFGPFLVPIFGYYNKTEKRELNLLLPSLADVNFSLYKYLRIGFRFNGSMKSYTLTKPKHLVDSYLAKSENQVGAYFDYHINNIHLNIFGGYSVGSSYRTYSEDDKLDLAISLLKIGEDRVQLNQDLEDGFILKASVNVRLNTNNQKNN